MENNYTTGLARRRLDFDIQAYFDRQGIHYVTRGPNTKKGNISIPCPFCGSADPSQHMGINLSTLQWGCWRDASHRGGSPIRLLMAVTHQSRAEIRNLLGLDRDTQLSFGTEGETLHNLDIDNLFGSAEEPVTESVTSLTFPKSIKPLRRSPLTERFYIYLKSRGFSENDLPRLIRRYRLHYALAGDYAMRVIFPVYMYGELVAWTGRAITDTEYRYRSTSIEESVINIYDSLLNFDQIKEKRPDVLFITEGPLDADKLDFYGRDHNCMATCIFTKIMSEIQLAYLKELDAYVGKMVVLLDPEETADTIKLTDQLSHFATVEEGEIPAGIEDPGAMTKREVETLCLGV